jgi:hypothetical protein
MPYSKRLFRQAADFHLPRFLFHCRFSPKRTPESLPKLLTQREQMDVRELG